MSSDCEPAPRNDAGGDGCAGGAGSSGGVELFVVVGAKALGDMYGDCKAETNADEGGDTSEGELYVDDSMELFMFAHSDSSTLEPIGAKMSLPELLMPLAILMVRPVLIILSFDVAETETPCARASLKRLEEGLAGLLSKSILICQMNLHFTTS